MRIISFVAPAAALLLLVEPVAGQVAPHAGIDAVYREFVAGYAELDASRVAGLYTDDALYLAGRSPALIGEAAIAGTFKGFFDAVRADGATLRLRFRIVERRVDDDAAWDLGFYHLTRLRGDSAGPPSVGRFVTGIRRDDSGRWRFVVDGFVESDLAAWEAAAGGLEP